MTNFNLRLHCLGRSLQEILCSPLGTCTEMYDQLKTVTLICLLPRSVSWKRTPSAQTQSWPSPKKRLLDTEIFFPDLFSFNFTEWLYQMGSVYDGLTKWEMQVATAVHKAGEERLSVWSRHHWRVQQSQQSLTDISAALVLKWVQM